MIIPAGLWISSVLYDLFKNGPARKLHLFVNDIWPSPGATVDDFVEPDVAGYQPAVLKPGAWVIAPGGAGAPSTATAAVVRFEFLDVGLVYGYFVTSADGSLAWAERFPDGPQPLDQKHGITLVPAFQLGTMADDQQGDLDDITLEGVV